MIEAGKAWLLRAQGSAHRDRDPYYRNKKDPFAMDSQAHLIDVWRQIRTASVFGIEAEYPTTLKLEIVFLPDFRTTFRCGLPPVRPGVRDALECTA